MCVYIYAFQSSDQSVSNRGLAFVDFLNRLGQIVIVFISQLHHAALPVQSLSDNLVRLHELVDFSGELIVLMADNSDVVVHGVDLDLEIGIVLEKGAVRVTGPLELLAHVQKLVLLLANLHL